MQVDSRNGIFSGLNHGDIVSTINGLDVKISYSGGDGNDIVLYTPRTIFATGDVSPIPYTSGNLFIANTQDGTLQINAGYEINTGSFDTIIGNSNSITGDLQLLGQNAKLTSRDLFNGEYGNGNIHIQNGAEITVQTNLYNGRQSGSNGQIHLQSNNSGIKSKN